MSASRPNRLGPFGAASAETRQFNDALARILEPLPGPGVVPVETVRALRAEGKGIFPLGGPLPEGRWETFDAAAFGAPGGPGRARIVEAAQPKGVLVHFHGGGWTFGSPDLEDHRNVMLSAAADLSVISVEYRLAPEHPWPACALDAAAGARWALARAAEMATALRVDPGTFPVFIGGESAGAHLAACTLLTLRAERLIDQIAGVVLTYGCFDLRMTPSLRNWGGRNLVLSTPIVAWFIDNLLGSNSSSANTAAVSPLLADLGGMPPAFFQVGDEDPLLDDTLFMAERWRAAGDEADLKVWPGGVHAFDAFHAPEHHLPIAAESHMAAAAWLKDRIAAL